MLKFTYGEKTRKNRPLSDEAIFLLSDKLAAMGDPIRLRILNQLCCRGEQNVAQLVEQCGAKQANVSRHLVRLRETGLVVWRKAGTKIFYALADDSLPSICACLRESAKTKLKRLSSSLDD